MGDVYLYVLLRKVKKIRGTKEGRKKGRKEGRKEERKGRVWKEKRKRSIRVIQNERQM